MLSRSDEVIARTHQCGEILRTLIVETTRAEQLCEVTNTLAARAQHIESATVQLGTHFDTLEAKKFKLENDLRHTGDLLDIADVSLAERYNRLGAAIARGTELGSELQAATAESLSSIELLKKEQLAAAQGLLEARNWLEKQLAAEQLEKTIQRAHSIEIGIPTRAGQGGVSASALFPTAR